ncbi:MAG: hypothetical protein R2856_15675 [Caldilineaceae bacterium]
MDIVAVTDWDSRHGSRLPARDRSSSASCARAAVSAVVTAPVSPTGVSSKEGEIEPVKTENANLKRLMTK